MLIAELNQEELAVRILEAMLDMRRPTQSASECLAHVEPELRNVAVKAAISALEYFKERINDLHGTT